MAPKTLPPQAKQSLILNYLQTSFTAHTIKELEKTLPAIASINSMHVKDHLQALSDDGKIHVEKIGSGNWYWSFASEEKRSREGVLRALRAEKAKLDLVVGELRGRVEAAREERGGEDGGRDELVVVKVGVEEEVRGLRGELEGYRDGDPGEVERRRAEVGRLRARAERWTDNIGVLEGYLKGLVGGDGAVLDALVREVYGGEYVEGEGLRELV